MAWLEFNDYATAAANIRGQRLRQEIADELLDHMEAKAEWLVSCGSTREQAVQQVLSGMGEAELIREQLDGVHHRLPEQRLSSALLKIIWGMLLQFFTLGSGYLALSASSLGVALLVTGLFQLRNSNKRLRRAFVFGCLFALWQAVVRCYSSLAAVDETLLLILVGPVLLCACLCMLGAGLDEICLAVPRNEGEKHSAIGSIGFLYGAGVAFGIFTLGGANWLILVALVCFIAVLVQLGKARSFMLLHLVDAGARELGTRGRAFSLSALAALILLPIACCAYMALQQPEAVRFPTQVSAAAEASRARLIEQGLDQRIAADLPEQELLLLAEADMLGLFTSWPELEEGRLRIEIALFQLTDEQARGIVRAQWEERPPRQLRDGLLFWPDLNTPPEDARVSCWSLSERNGQTMRQDFITTSPPDRQAGFYRYMGGEFRLRRGDVDQRIYVAADLVNLHYSDFPELSVQVSYTHRTSLLLTSFVSSGSPYGWDAPTMIFPPGKEDFSYYYAQASTRDI